MSARVSPRGITAENRAAVCALRVRPARERFVAPVTASLAER
ncbi:hypothetical protein [Umezawaea beigongshangensis]|nr:hypothetical protein [Umezawaea beigongshangensis]